MTAPANHAIVQRLERAPLRGRRWHRATRAVSPAGCTIAALLFLAVSPVSSSEPAASELPMRGWLTDLGAEGLPADLRSIEVPGSIWVAVPGAALSFSVAADGTLTKIRRVATDFSTGHAVAASPQGHAVADRNGVLSLWGITPDGGSEALVWRHAIGTRVMSVGWDGGERIWVSTREGELIAVASETGERLWSAPLGGRAEAPPVGAGGDVFVATKSERALRFDAATGALRWDAKLSGSAIHPPVLAQGPKPVLVCGTWNGWIHALDAATGARLWRVRLPGRLAGTPAVGPDRVVAVSDDGSAHAWDLAGQPVWQAKAAARGVATLIVSHSTSETPRVQVVSERLAMLDLATGQRLDVYPDVAVQELRSRFVDAMMNGEKTYSEVEKRALLERHAFAISGSLFGRAQIQGPALVFGTEDSWVYLFDAATLRPVYRYHVGQPALTLPDLAGGRLVTSSAEHVFGLDPHTGEIVWRRGLGGTPHEIVAGSTLAILAGERLSTLDPKDGSRGWTQRSRARFVSRALAEREGREREVWLLAGAGGALQLLDASGRALAEFPVVGTPLRPVARAGSHSWAVATREGRVFGLSFTEPAAGLGAPESPAAGLAQTWEHDIGEPIAELRSAGALLVARLESGALVSLDAESGAEAWRLPIGETENYAISSRDEALIVSGADTLRLHEIGTGLVRFERPLTAPAVGAELAGRELRWLDRAGWARSVDIVDGRLLEEMDLGVLLEAAAPSAAGFLVKTSAGEVGVVSTRIAAAPAAAATVPDETRGNEEGARR